MTFNLMAAQELGQKWYQTFYDEVVQSLRFSKSQDEFSRNVLSLLLRLKSNLVFPDSEKTSQVGIVFGAGPSLVDDVRDLRKFISKNKPVLIAADGAADGIYATCKLHANFIVSDLDSCSPSMLEEQSRFRHLFIHSHGNNLENILKIVPGLGNNLTGTTQIEPLENVANIGGLTDGDRACFLAAALNLKTVIIAGMSFGTEEGSFSKNRSNQKFDFSRWLRKLEFGKKSLEFLVRNSPSMTFINVTKNGVPISGARQMTTYELNREIS